MIGGLYSIYVIKQTWENINRVLKNISSKGKGTGLQVQGILTQDKDIIIQKYHLSFIITFDSLFYVPDKLIHDLAPPLLHTVCHSAQTILEQPGHQLEVTPWLKSGKLLLDH